MPFNRLENVSTANPMPVQEMAGTYNAKEHISASNPLPVMEVEGGSYSNYETVSEANPQPVAIISDSGPYSRHEDYSDTNAFPVKFIVGQSYDPRFDVSETNPWPVVVVSGGGGAEAYTTGAVHFDGVNTAVSNASVACTDSGALSLSFWIKNSPQEDAKSVYVVDPNDYNTYTLLALANGPAFSFANLGGSRWLAVSPNPGIADAGWHHVLVSVDTNFAAGAKLHRVYLDGVDQTSVDSDGSLAFQIAINGRSMILGEDGFGSGGTFDISDFWFAPSQSILVGGDVPEATLRKFISAEGKPVDLGADGSTPTGTAPAIFLRRAPAGAASTFASNLGTGGAFSITGTLTNAATSPSD